MRVPQCGRTPVQECRTTRRAGTAFWRTGTRCPAGAVHRLVRLLRARAHGVRARALRCRLRLPLARCHVRGVRHRQRCAPRARQRCAPRALQRCCSSWPVCRPRQTPATWESPCMPSPAPGGPSGSQRCSSARCSRRPWALPRTTRRLCSVCATTDEEIRRKTRSHVPCARRAIGPLSRIPYRAYRPAARHVGARMPDCTLCDVWRARWVGVRPPRDTHFLGRALVRKRGYVFSDTS